MNEQTLWTWLLYGWFGLAAVTFLVLQFISAPYGRHIRKGWGWVIPSRLGWILMELPAVAVPLLCFWFSSRQNNPVLLVFLGLWLFHYVQRTFVYPFRMRMDGKTMPVLIAALAFCTNVGIDYLNFRYFFHFGPVYTTAWLTDPRFLLGSALFFAGFFINVQSDTILRDLRKPGETGYKIPYGGAYRWVSCPNYFGEILEWTGFAIATWSLPALAFLLWTMSNLTPRALENHRWYQETFDEYPTERKALLPFLL
jgi:hypothetical protein